MVSHGKLALLCYEALDHPSFSFEGYNVLITRDRAKQILVISQNQPLVFPENYYFHSKRLSVLPRKHALLGWGRYNIIDTAMRLLNTKVRQSTNIFQPIIIGGHGIGAALSQSLGLQMLKENYLVQSWTGFGSPSVFCRIPMWQKTKLTNYRFGKDIVPNYLLSHLFFRHPCTLTTISESYQSALNWSDHALENYVNYLYNTPKD